MVSVSIPTVRRVAALLLAVALVLTVTTGVAAADSVRGAAGSIVVEEGETVDDVEAVAGTVVIRGTVTGSVSMAAGSVHVAESGRIGGDVELAAGTVRIDGRIDGDADVAAGSIDVTETARIGGALEAGAGYVSIDGRIDGDVDVGAETVVLGPNASVGGDVRYDAETFTRDPGASVAGSVVERRSRGTGDATMVAGGVVGSVLSAVYGALANLLLGSIFLVIFPDFSAGVASRVADAPARSAGIGLVTLVGVPIVALVVALTLVGIPLAVVGLLAFGTAVWAGLVYGQYAVGVRALATLDREHRWLALVVGVLGVAVLGIVPVLGALVQFGVLVVGLGALVVGLRRTYRGSTGGETGRQATLDEGFDDDAS
jgi:cytoskeletal protein CcmA (bactofilin family)